ncbi:MAG TPA: NAD(P)-dependent alcohol dehydrogenase [Polyangia bacterium]|nr:NAD(P)-dependent alcohol dehydrogenase [Polyangia bacterium]HVZ85569.1 NAD(P)-dependent alcohol dehydrogenase [Polyangia bacterium]
MTTPIRAQAALAKGGALEPFAYDPAPLGPHDIEIEVSHCGLCHSDIHLIDDGWGRSKFPQVPGHEIVGKVAAAGDLVTHVKVGDRVGVGWQRSACLECDLCISGQENLCPKQQATCMGHHGGLADRIRIDGRFAFLLPAELDSAVAAPLLCGGVTVFSPMRRFGIGATSRVAVIGIGGLGHMALLMLRALGADTTAFSTTPDKRAEALAMGANDFSSSTDPKELRRHFGRFDLILSTVHARLDWTTYLQTLRANGSLCLLGIPPGVVQFPPSLLITGQRSITGSDIGSRSLIREMLEFVTRHKIAPQIQHLPMSEANAGLTRLRANQVRYRLVLER